MPPITKKTQTKKQQKSSENESAKSSEKSASANESEKSPTTSQNITIEIPKAEEKLNITENGAEQKDSKESENRYDTEWIRETRPHSTSSNHSSISSISSVSSKSGN